MKTLFILSLLFCLVISCTKSYPDNSHLSSQAIVTQLKYACGPSCDASVWAVQTAEGRWYEPIDIPLNFKVDHLAVSLVYERTGQHSLAGQGAGEEKIRILQITKR